MVRFVRLRAPVMVALIVMLAAASPAGAQTLGADLIITVSDGDVAVERGDTLTYTVVVGNNGPDAAENVKVLNALPDGTSYLGSDASAGTCGETGGIVMCDLGTIESGAAARILVSVLINEIPDATIENTYVVSSSTTDPDPTNNTAEETSSSIEVLPSTGAVDQVILPMAALAILAGTYFVVWARRSRATYLLDRSP
ncbi:MAG: DUF11 domain-containing protein [Acidimicrobiia bacterium]|nr:DUF11 domain-containing protein [Acidimicrobiia bacterium]NNL26838.1 DUF11 domain-containing protein [Acidimicrobiia bacterium]